MASGVGLNVALDIEGDASADPGSRAYAVDDLVHLAMTAEDPFHGVRCGRQQRIIKERQGLVEFFGKQLVTRSADVREAAYAAAQA